MFREHKKIFAQKESRNLLFFINSCKVPLVSKRLILYGSLVNTPLRLFVQGLMGRKRVKSVTKFVNLECNLKYA